MDRQNLPQTLESYMIQKYEALKAENARLYHENKKWSEVVDQLNKVIDAFGEHLGIRESVSGNGEFLIEINDYIYNTYDHDLFYQILDCFGLKLPADKEIDETDEIDEGYQE